MYDNEVYHVSLTTEDIKLLYAHKMCTCTTHAFTCVYAGIQCTCTRAHAHTHTRAHTM